MHLGRVLFVYAFRQRIKKYVIQQLHSQVEDSPKSMHYKSFKVMLELESYLKIDLPLLYRKILVTFR